MAQKLWRVVRSCVELGDGNPIVQLHDQGAGGNCNVVKELIYPLGGKIDIRAVKVKGPPSPRVSPHSSLPHLAGTTDTAFIPPAIPLALPKQISVRLQLLSPLLQRNIKPRRIHSCVMRRSDDNLQRSSPFPSTLFSPQTDTLRCKLKRPPSPCSINSWATRRSQ
eukprot:125541-Chlamydomonas_euryale.AAC.1